MQGAVLFWRDDLLIWWATPAPVVLVLAVVVGVVPWMGWAALPVRPHSYGVRGCLSRPTVPPRVVCVQVFGPGVAGC